MVSTALTVMNRALTSMELQGFELLSSFFRHGCIVVNVQFKRLLDGFGEERRTKNRTERGLRENTYRQARMIRRRSIRASLCPPPCSIMVPSNQICLRALPHYVATTRLLFLTPLLVETNVVELLRKHVICDVVLDCLFEASTEAIQTLRQPGPRALHLRAHRTVPRALVFCQRREL